MDEINHTEEWLDWLNDIANAYLWTHDSWDGYPWTPDP